MRKYLATLHSKPDHHKRRFALLASSTVTLLIFGIWSLVTFKSHDNPVALSADNETKIAEVGPLESFSASIAASLNGLKASFNELKSDLESKDIEKKYEDLRNGALDTYGQ